MVIMDDKLDKLEETSQTSTEIANTWNSAQENLLAAIADRANCYRWLHNECYSRYETYNFYLTVPSVVLSAVTGSATIGLTSLFNPESQKGASIVIGLFTLGCGALTSVNQFMKTSQYSEAHRTASIAYGKLHRVISSELSLRRDQRLNALEFIKVVRSEQDRLHETSPHILKSIIAKFREDFKDHVDLEKPEIVGDLDHVQVNKSRKYDDPTPTAPRVGSPQPSFYYNSRKIKPHPNQSSATAPPLEDTVRADLPVASPCPANEPGRGSTSLPQSANPNQQTC